MWANVNWFVIGAAALYFAATVQASFQGKWTLGIIYICYAVANAALFYIDWHTK